MTYWAEHRRSNSKLYIVFGICAVLIIGLGITVAVLLTRGDNNSKDAKAAKNEAESNTIIEDVSKLYMVPTDEKPTVAAIKDKSKLSNQPFFEDAKDGDYLLVYNEAKLALVYRKSANKLVNVSPINPNANSGSTNGQQTGQ